MMRAVPPFRLRRATTLWADLRDERNVVADLNADLDPLPPAMAAELDRRAASAAVVDLVNALATVLCLVAVGALWCAG